MNYLLSFLAFTANILGPFNDPFEFDGDYGEEINPTRQAVFEKLLPQDKEGYGPTLSELLTQDLIDRLPPDPKILEFIEAHREERLFGYFRSASTECLKIDKTIRQYALPILSSTEPLVGSDAHELKSRLLDALFTPQMLQRYKTFDLFYYWLYQSLNLQLVADDAESIERINHVKQLFLATLGDREKRASLFRQKLIDADAGLLFTQECDSFVVSRLTEDGLFYPVDDQNASDGTLVFLRSDLWEKGAPLPVDSYPNEGKINALLATLKETGELFLLASAHGASTNAADGRLQISAIAAKHQELAKAHPSLQLIIGIDANTKSDEEVARLHAHLSSLNLIATSVGPTTIKRRMVTVQHSKAGRYAADEEDFLITHAQGHYALTHPTVGFSPVKPDPAIPLPNLDNPSDHYPVGATLESLSRKGR